MALRLLAGEFYGSIRAGLGGKDEMIGNNALRIAANAKAAGLILVTNMNANFDVFRTGNSELGGLTRARRPPQSLPRFLRARPAGCPIAAAHCAGF